VGFKEAFWPLYEMDDAEPITLTNIALRASFALLAAGVSWLLYANSPDKGMQPSPPLLHTYLVAQMQSWGIFLLNL